MEYRIYHTIKEIVKHAEDTYGSCDAVRYKTGKDTIADAPGGCHDACGG